MITIVGQDFIDDRLQSPLLKGEEIRITPFTSEIAIPKANEYVRDPGMKPFALYRMENLDNRVCLSQMSTSKFSGSNQLHEF